MTNEFGRMLRGTRAAFALTLGLAGLMLGSAGSARAQIVDEAARKPFSISIGDFIPSSKDTTRIGGVHNFAAEVGYTIQRQPEQSSVSVISLGYIEREGFRTMPLTISQILRDPGTGRNNLIGIPYYYGLGVGLYNTRMSSSDTDGRNKWLFGGFVTAGLDITPMIFAEAKYHYPFKYDNKFFGGLLFSVGARF